MPAKKSAASSSKATTKPFDFKSIKKDKPSAKKGGDSSKRVDKPTRTKVQRSVIQSGEREGELGNNWYFIFNPRFGLNDKAIEAVQKLAGKGDEVGKYNKGFDGFPVRVATPKQAQAMHDALRASLPRGSDDLPEELEVNGFEAPVVTAVTLANVTYSTREDSYNEVTAIMLDGANVYPIKEDLKSECNFAFSYGVHGHAGVNRWMARVDDRDVPALQKKLAKVLAEKGYECELAEADAADWEDDDDEE